MKLIKVTGLLYLLIPLLSCDSETEFNQLRKDFAFPPSAYKTASGWVWSGVVTEGLIDNQLEDFQQHGIGGVFIHAGTEVYPEYATDQWYELVSYAMKKAGSLNMKIWPHNADTSPDSGQDGIYFFTDLINKSEKEGMIDPDHLAMLAWDTVQAIGLRHDGQTMQLKNIRVLRKLNSLGNQLGIKRKFSENYAASEGELTFEDMKSLGDYEYVLGANMLNLHHSLLSQTGDHKRDHPPSFSHHTTSWDSYKTMMEYFSRLSVALSAGTQHNRVLILEPTTSERMYDAQNEDNKILGQINDTYSSLLERLEEEQVEYDLGCENIIKDHGYIENGKIVIGKQQYSYVVLPPMMENINGASADLLEEFMESGGFVLSLGLPPKYIDGVVTERCKVWSTKFLEEWHAINNINDPRFISFLLSDEFILVEQEGGNLFHQRRILDGGQLLFLVNSSKEEACETRFVMQGKDMVKMNSFTGEIENYPCVLTSDILSFIATIPPAGSLLLYISDTEIKSRN